jgi:hypothetical protein
LLLELASGTFETGIFFEAKYTIKYLNWKNFHLPMGRGEKKV